MKKNQSGIWYALEGANNNNFNLNKEEHTS